MKFGFGVLLIAALFSTGAAEASTYRWQNDASGNWNVLVRPALNWGLAEGRIGGPNEYTTYILLANPNADAADVTVKYLRESGVPVVKTYSVPGNTRFNIDVGGMVPELQNESFGASIMVTNKVPIAVERSMYWSVNGVLWQGGTNALGSVMPPLQ